MSKDNLDDILDTIAQGSKRSKSSKSPNQDNVDPETFDSSKDSSKDPNTKKAYSDLSNGDIDYYKIIGASPEDSQDEIRRKCNRKVAKYHPDKVNLLLVKVPEEERAKEKKRLDMQYKLIRQAYSVLKDVNKRKWYDLQRKSIKSSSLTHQKQSFSDFIKLQTSEISESTKEQAQTNFKMASLELDRKHGFNRNELNEPKMSKHETEKKLSDLIIVRDMIDIECTKKNMFEGRSFDQTEFNKQWEKMNKKEKKKGTSDQSIIKWSGVSASNDFGLVGSSDFVSVENNYDNLYSTQKPESCEFGTVFSSSSEEEFNFSSDTEDTDKDEGIEKHNYDKDDVMAKYNEIMNDRMINPNQPNCGGVMNDRMIIPTNCGSIMDGPMNISSQMNSMIGEDYKIAQSMPRNKKHVDKEMVEAYKHLVYENDK